MPELQRNPAQDYLEAVRALTEPHRVPIVSPDGAPLGERLAAPLLLTLGANVGSGVMRGGGAGGEARTRTPLNVGAADLLSAIRGRVLDDYRGMVGGGARPDVIPALVAVRLPVLNRYRAGRISLRDLEARTRRLEGWAVAIGDLLDPPMRVELTAPCPRCGARWTIDTDGDQVPALSTTYRDVRDAISQCAECGHLWHGIDGARRLRIDIDAAERMRGLLLGVAG